MKLHWTRTAAQVFLLFFVASVICQDLVFVGYVGKSVLLPCNSTKSSPVNVFWRDRNDLVLLDILQGQPDLESPDKKYKGRVSRFQDKNFSIVLEKLEKSDTGNYECTIISNGLPERHRVRLTVKEDVGNSATCGASNVLQMFVLSALSLLLF